jgi:hypothetical protein
MYKIVVAISLMTKPDNGEAFYKIFILLKSRHVMPPVRAADQVGPKPGSLRFGRSDHRHCTKRVGDDPSRDRANQPALEQTVPSMTHDDVIDVMSLGKTHNLFCRVAYSDVDMRLEGLLRVLGLHCAQRIVMVLARLLNQGFRLNHTAKLGWTRNRENVHRRPKCTREARCESEGMDGCLRAVITDQNVAHHKTLLAAASAGTVVAADSDSALDLSRCRGKKNALAIKVGTTALATTAATTAEYCARVITPCDSPKSADIVPNVRPVDISSVV